MDKKRPPIEQLLEAGEEARKKLVEKGVLSADNLVEQTAKKHPDLILPGIPSYLPHKWTIKDSQRMMYDIFKMWQFENKREGVEDKTENLTAFIEFCIKEMNYHEEVAKKKMDTQGSMIKHLKKVPVLGKIFEPMNQYQTIKGIRKFFVDSLAVAIIVNGETATTSEFAEFFFNWTEKLYKIWESQNEKKKRVR